MTAKIGDVGTLKELGVQVGDVVVAVSWDDGRSVGEFYDGITWAIMDRHPKGYCNCVCAVYKEKGGGYTTIDEGMTFRLISRANQPKLWRDMTPEEKGALLLAAHEGETIGVWFIDHWEYVNGPHKNIAFIDNAAYRIKPEPKRETVNQGYKKNAKGHFVTTSSLDHATHRITFDTIDGEPDCASVKMEKL